MRINHGAPCFDVVSPRFRMACEELAAEGFVKPFDGVCGTLSCGDSSYEFTPNAHSDLFVGTPGMSALCRGLLNGVSQTEDCNLQVSPRFSTMVRGIKWVQVSKVSLNVMSSMHRNDRTKVCFRATLHF